MSPIWLFEGFVNFSFGFYYFYHAHVVYFVGTCVYVNKHVTRGKGLSINFVLSLFYIIIPTNT